MTFLSVVGFLAVLALTLYMTFAAIAVSLGEAIFSGKVGVGGVFFLIAAALWALTIWTFPFTVSLSGG